MEIKINREIRNYTESMFFGLSMRQFIFAVAGCGIAVLLYFILKPFFGVETLSWMCMLGAAPFIACGFVTYNGMTAEQFAWAWLKSKFIEPVKVKFECDTLYSTVMEKSKKDVFWAMNEISFNTATKTENVVTETDDGNGNIVETTESVTRTYLYIRVAHKSVDEMATYCGFTESQKEQLRELMSEDNKKMWSGVLYGYYTGGEDIVSVALTQVGNTGGQPYWSWYGFGSRVEWCACFVSWCANECGYIETGVVLKYAGCVNGVQWFKDRGQWMDGSAEPVPGMIILFDWDSPDGSSGPQDGLSDHMGIVQKVENGIVYTVEGNSVDSVRVNQYPVGHYEILGYGIPQY